MILRYTVSVKKANKNNDILRIGNHVFRRPIRFIVSTAALITLLAASNVFFAVSANNKQDSIVLLQNDNDSLNTANRDGQQQITQLKSSNQVLKDDFYKLANAVMSEHSQEINAIYNACINAKVAPGNLAQVETLDQYHANCKYTQDSWLEGYAGISSQDVQNQ